MISHAYALIPDGVGRFRAVHIRNLIADDVEHLEPNGRPETAITGLARITSAMATRHRRKEWG